MPTTPMKNNLYRLGLILFAPSVATQQVLFRYREDETLPLSPDYGPGRLFKRHHMLGGTLLLDDGKQWTQICSSLKTAPKRVVTPATVFRAASITKMVTAACVLRLAEKGLLRLEDRIFDRLPTALSAEHPLRAATVEQVLCHRSGLRDTPAYEAAFARGDTYDAILADASASWGTPGGDFAYCNLGFGLLGSLIETVTGECLEAVYQREVFVPLEMNATLDVTQADKEHTLPISRVLPYRAKRAWQVEAAAEKARPLAQPDPLHHFGYAAGSLYTDAASLDHFLTMLVQHGEYQGQCYLSSASIAAMTTAHASYGSIAPTLAYGLGLLLINDPALSPRRILGHQGFAYGCVNGAFYEEGTGRRVILLNGGASEARMGRLGRINRDILRWALREDNDAWT